VSTLAVVAAVVLGAVFVVAGGSKLAAASAWRAQATGLGVAPAVAAVVPWIELAVGALLIVQIGEPWPAVAALVLLVAFSLLIAVHLARGRRPPCACFGALSARPIGPGHLARNAIFAALAVVALAA
jgi:uncharacterized membrane protein YphA (DoxX/SURF4 family)